MKEKENVSKKEVVKTAELARLDLDKKEKDQFSRQLADVLANFSKINEVDTEGVEITAQVTGLEDVLAEDDSKKALNVKRSKLLENAPKTEDGYMVVPKVL